MVKEISDKALEQFRHKNRMEEIETQRQAHLEVEKLKFENQMSMHRLRRTDRKRQVQEEAYLRQRK